MTRPGAAAADRIADPVDEAELVRLARRIVQWRRRRDQLLKPLVFADPEWDILLDLYAAGAERSVSMSSLCIAAAVPTTTAFRCITAMVDQGALVRMRDPDDARRMLVTLSRTARRQMRAWLMEAARSLAPA